MRAGVSGVLRSLGAHVIASEPAPDGTVRLLTSHLRPNDLLLLDLFIRGEIGPHTEVDESKSPSYPSEDMDEAAKACKPAADYFGLPVAVVTETLAELRAKAARDTTGRTTEKPRTKTIADAKAEALAIGDATLLGQLIRYEGGWPTSIFRQKV